MFGLVLLQTSMHSIFRFRHIWRRRFAEYNTSNLELWRWIWREIWMIFRVVTNDHSSFCHQTNKYLYKSEGRLFRETSLILLFPTFPAIRYINWFLKSLCCVFLINFWMSAKKYSPLGISLKKFFFGLSLVPISIFQLFVFFLYIIGLHLLFFSFILNFVIA